MYLCMILLSSLIYNWFFFQISFDDGVTAAPRLIALPWVESAYDVEHIPDYSEDFHRLFFLPEGPDAASPARVTLPQAAYEAAFQAIIMIYSCPICLDYMYPDYLDCGRGHNFCGSCVRMMRSCPFCRSRGPIRRVRVLEEAAEKLRFACVFQANGCDRITHLSEWEEHCNLCAYNPTNM